MKHNLLILGYFCSHSDISFHIGKFLFTSAGDILAHIGIFLFALERFSWVGVFQADAEVYLVILGYFYISA